MRPERRLELLLIDIAGAADTVASALDRLEGDQLSQDDVLRAAVVGQLILIGEAASRLPDDFRSAHAEIEWPRIIGFRHVAVHAYEQLDESILDVTARERVPELQRQVMAILWDEYPLAARALDEHNSEEG